MMMFRIAENNNIIISANYVDNLVNSSRESIVRTEKLTGKKITFYEEDLCNREGLEAIFAKEKVDAVIHFAGLKAVGESCEKPLEYFSGRRIG